MRKVIVTMNIKFFERFLPKESLSIMDKVEYMEGLHLVKLDIVKGIKIVIVEFKFKDGYTLKDLGLPEYVHILDVVEQEDNRCICLVKVVADERMKGMMRFFNQDVIYEPPFRYKDGKVIISFLSDSKTIQTVLKAFQLLGVVDDISIHRAILSDTSPIGLLTEKQKETVLTAKKMGYYEIPRRTDSRKLARALHLSKATALEHLRKAEKRLLNHMLQGY